MNTITKKEFKDSLKYGRYHSEILKKMIKFKQHVVKEHNGSVSTIYQKDIKQLIITTYLPDWKLKEYIIKESSRNTYRLTVNVTAGNLFSPFVREILMNHHICWFMDNFITNGIMNYYVSVIPLYHV